MWEVCLATAVVFGIMLGSAGVLAFGVWCFKRLNKTGWF